MTAVSASSARRKVGSFQKKKVSLCSVINVQKNYIITDIAQIIIRSIPHTLDKIIIIKLCNTPVRTNKQETASS